MKKGVFDNTKTTEEAAMVHAAQMVKHYGIEEARRLAALERDKSQSAFGSALLKALT